MALKLKYTDELGILHIDMSPTSSCTEDSGSQPRAHKVDSKTDISDPKFDTINNRFGPYDLFGGKYDTDSGEPKSLFRSRYNSIEEELANTPYAFATERSLRLNDNQYLDITIKSRGSDGSSPSKDIQDDRFFNRTLSVECDDSLFGPRIDFASKSSVRTSEEEETPAFTVTQLIHAQDRYYDLSGIRAESRTGDYLEKVRSAPNSAKNLTKVERTVKIVDDVGNVSVPGEAFKVLSTETETRQEKPTEATSVPISVPTSKKKRESSFAIIATAPQASRPSSPRSLPSEIKSGRVSPFRGRGFREETSRHSTPKTSATNSRASSPPRRTSSLTTIDKMATATLPPLLISRPHSPVNFIKQNMEEVREHSELNREKHEAIAEQKRKEEEDALLKEMAEFDKNVQSEIIKSVGGSRTTSRNGSPNKINLRSRSTSPSAILRYENISVDSEEFINSEDGMAKPVAHRSRFRSMSKSQPQSNDGSPKHSKIPKRQSSVSPPRPAVRRGTVSSRRSIENNLNKNQRFISNSTSSINETIKLGSLAHDKRYKSTQQLSVPSVIKGKPPISPGRGGPPPSNKTINPKRLSPIVGTPNKSPTESIKPESARGTTKPSPATRRSVKTTSNSPATSRFSSKPNSRNASREPSPDKRKAISRSTVPSKTPSKPITGRQNAVSRTQSTRTTQQKPSVQSKPEPKKPMSRTSSMKSLARTPSTKNLTEKPPLLKRDSKKDIKEKAKSTSKINEAGIKLGTAKESNMLNNISNSKSGSAKPKDKPTEVSTEEKATDPENIPTQDNETQYDKITNEKGELILLTKKSIISMTTAAITAQPLEIVTTVTNQLPSVLEKAREKALFERNSSKDSISAKDDSGSKLTENEMKDKLDDKKPPKPKDKVTHNLDDSIKLKPLQPPYNNLQIERAKQKIDDILQRSPEVSTEKILPQKESTKSFKSIADQTKNTLKESKNETTSKFIEIKEDIIKNNEKIAEESRSEALKIVESIITPVEEPKDVVVDVPKNVVKNIEPIVMVVSEKIKEPLKHDIEKMTETLVKGDADVEVQSSNVSSANATKKVFQNNITDGNGSDKSIHSNGGFPQSTSTTPKPPIRAHRLQKDQQAIDQTDSPNSPAPNPSEHPDQGLIPKEQEKKPNICIRIMNKCKSKCCPCCLKPENDDMEERDMKSMEEHQKGKPGALSRLNCCKKPSEDEMTDAERGAGKISTIEFESEAKRKRKVRDVFCGWCDRRRRVADLLSPSHRDVTAPEVVDEAGCCGKRRQAERRDSILSDNPPSICCNNRLGNWFRGACRRHSEHDSSSRRTSLFSKNKSLSPTLPPEDTRPKLDSSLIEHTSHMRGAIPVLPMVLAVFCLMFNVLVPGLGTILSGVFCLCFGIPRFGVHDGAKYRIGALVINILVGCAQLFTVLFCLVGWGWSIWWGVIMVKISRKYRKLKAEADTEQSEAPPVTTNNHTRA